MLRRWLIDYSKDVVRGEVIACRKHEWACKRFLRDIEREGTEEFPYVFDEAKAQRFLDWMMLFKHSKGVLAGQKIVPSDIQAFVFASVYGWVHKETELRRFKKFYWQVARKNAKSQSLALVALYEAFAFGQNQAEVFCAATRTEQARIIWREAKWLIDNCTDLKGKYKVAYGKIEHLKSGSFIQALSREDNKKGDGTHPQAAVIDEYHLHDISEVLDNMASGMGARTQPLLSIITTAGFDLAKPCYRVEYKYIAQILDPNNPVTNEEYFAMVNEMDEGDDVKDERNWVKANPILCSYDEGLNYLRGQIKEALDVPEKMRNFLTKNMNVWINLKEKGYLDLSKWVDCGGELPDLNGLECFMGVDLSSKIDLTSVSFEFPLVDGRYAILSHSFMPEDTLEERMKMDSMPYDLWVDQGWISLTSGAVVDYRFIESYVEEQVKENGWVIKEICYDPYNATQFAQNMESEGYMPVEIRQGMKTLAEPTKNFREMVLQKRIVHNNNPVLTWAVGNAITRQDHNENIMLDKDKSAQRIDPIVAVINAHVRAMVLQVEETVYKTGMEIFSV